MKLAQAFLVDVKMLHGNSLMFGCCGPIFLLSWPFFPTRSKWTLFPSGRFFHLWTFFPWTYFPWTFFQNTPRGRQTDAHTDVLITIFRNFVKLILEYIVVDSLKDCDDEMYALHLKSVSVYDEMA